MATAADNGCRNIHGGEDIPGAGAGGAAAAIAAATMWGDEAAANDDWRVHNVGDLAATDEPAAGDDGGALAVAAATAAAVGAGADADATAAGDGDGSTTAAGAMTSRVRDLTLPGQSGDQARAVGGTGDKSPLGHRSGDAKGEGVRRRQQAAGEDLRRSTHRRLVDPR